MFNLSLNKLFEETKSKLLFLTEFNFWKNYLLLQSFAILIILLFYLFTNHLEIFKLNLKDIKWWTFFTASFFHADKSHLYGNIIPYIILTSINCILFYKINLIKQIKKFYFLSFLILPFIISSLDYLFFKIILNKNVPPISGSSAIVSAIIGFTFYSLLIIFNIKNKIGKLILLLLYIIPLYLNLQFNLNPIPSFLMLLTPLSVYSLYKSTNVKYSYYKFLYSTIIIISISLYTTAAFPNDITQENSFINILAHFFGLLYGLIVGYFITK